MILKGYVKRSDLDGGFLSVMTHTGSVVVDRIQIYELIPCADYLQIEMKIDIYESIPPKEITEKDIKKLKREGLIE